MQIVERMIREGRGVASRTHKIAQQQAEAQREETFTPAINERSKRLPTGEDVYRRLYGHAKQMHRQRRIVTTLLQHGEAAALAATETSSGHRASPAAAAPGLLFDESALAASPAMVGATVQQLVSQRAQASPTGTARLVFEPAEGGAEEEDSASGHAGAGRSQLPTVTLSAPAASFFSPLRSAAATGAGAGAASAGAAGAGTVEGRVVNVVQYQPRYHFILQRAYASQQGLVSDESRD